jgi:hypothetical protein
MSLTHYRTLGVMLAAVVFINSPLEAAGAHSHAAKSTVSSSHAGKSARAKKEKKHKGDTAAPRARRTPRPSVPATRASAPHHSNRCQNCDRDEHGKILRSGRARKAFESATGYPHGRPGYVIDHIRPLACGGQDVPSNMQWQTKAGAKAKDKNERASCR